MTKVDGLTEDGLTHQIARTNVVLASLVVLTGHTADGSITVAEFYEPAVSDDRLAMLKAAAAMQTELSLSISVSDPMIWDASHGLRARANELSKTRDLSDVLLGVDRIVQDWLLLIHGKGPQLLALTDQLLERGELPLSEIHASLA